MKRIIVSRHLKKSRELFQAGLSLAALETLGSVFASISSLPASQQCALQTEMNELISAFDSRALASAHHEAEQVRDRLLHISSSAGGKYEI